MHRRTRGATTRSTPRSGTSFRLVERLIGMNSAIRTVSLPPSFATVVMAIALVASACGGSSDDAGDLGIDTGDAELDAQLEEIIDDVDDELGAGGEPDPRFIGYRAWSFNGVDELLEGEVNNLAANPFDEFAFEGPRFDIPLGPPGTGGENHLPSQVSFYDASWVIAGQGEQIARLDYATNSVNVTINANELVPDSTIRSLLGDEDAIYAVVDLLDTFTIVELDPTTGEQRRQVNLPSPGGSVTGADSNGEWLTVSFNASAIPIPLIDRASLTLVAEIVNLDNKAAILTTTQLAVIERAKTASGNDMLRFYSLADRSEGELIELPSNGSTRSFGDTIIHNDPRESVALGVAGHGTVIADALASLTANFIEIQDIHIGDGFAVVSACCGDTASAERQSLFVIDLGSGEILLSAPARGIVVPPPGS